MIVAVLSCEDYPLFCGTQGTISQMKLMYRYIYLSVDPSDPDCRHHLQRVHQTMIRCIFATVESDAD